jgi:hypothetical protein
MCLNVNAKFHPHHSSKLIFLVEILKADCGLVSGKSIAQIKPIEKAAGLFVRRIPAIARMLLFGRNLHFGRCRTCKERDARGACRRVTAHAASDKDKKKTGERRII